MKPRKEKSGPARMMELGRVKIEVWLTLAQMKEFEKLCEALLMKKATVARRALNYAARGGYQAMRCLSSDALD